MLAKLIFEVPAKFAAGLADGSLVRIGALIKDSGTGNIVAHIQESGLGQQLASSALGSPFSSLNTASSLAANVQLGQLQTMVAGLQMLQYANLGVALTGVGVCVAGFAVVNKKLKNIESGIAKLSQKVDAHFAEFYENQLRRDLYRVRGMFERIELARRLSEPRIELNAVASSLTEISSVIRGQIEYLLQRPTFDESLLTLLTQAMTTIDNARVEAYLLANETDSAYYATEGIANNYCDLFDSITPYDLHQKHWTVHKFGSDRVRAGLGNTLGSAKDLVTGLRDIADAAMTKPLLILELDRQNIPGPDYIAALKDENEQPLVLLSCAH